MNGTGLSLMPEKRCFTNRYADGGLTAIVSIVVEVEVVEVCKYLWYFGRFSRLFQF